MTHCYFILQILYLLAIFVNTSKPIDISSVQIYHIIDNVLWGEIDGSYLQGNFKCPQFKLNCTLLTSDSTSDFFNVIKSKFQRFNRESVLTVGLYNIHTWKTLSSKPYKPDKCNLPTHFNLVESEESFARFQHLFMNSFPHYDGNSTTLPTSSIPRSYISSINVSTFLPKINYENLIKGGVFVASTCHRDRSTTKREDIIKELRKYIRIDGLGKCAHQVSADSAILKLGNTALETLQLKQQALNKYLFYFAFENTIEPGYITEKVFDGLIAGTIPVYLGATNDCKKLVNISKAIIYMDDYMNISAIGTYLNHLMNNKVEYEEHRQWRNDFQIEHMSELLTKSWPCRICEWAYHKAKVEGIKTNQC